MSMKFDYNSQNYFFCLLGLGISSDNWQTLGDALEATGRKRVFSISQGSLPGNRAQPPGLTARFKGIEIEYWISLCLA